MSECIVISSITVIDSEKIKIEPVGNEMEGKKRIKRRKISIILVLSIFIIYLSFIPTISVGNDIVFSFNPWMENRPPYEPTNSSPSDGATGVPITVTLSVFVTDPDETAMEVYFYNAADDSLIGLTAVGNGTNAECVWSNLQYGAHYSWYVIANDTEYETTSETWSFTTLSPSTPSSPSDPSPPPLKLPPIANIAGPTIEYVDETFILSGHYSYDPDGGTIVAYRWDFDNDSVFDTDWLEETRVKGSYHVPGNYTIILEVKDDEGDTNTTELNITITVLEPDQERPIVIVHGPDFTIVNKTVYFNSSGSYDPDGYIVIYYWDFGDYTYSFEQNPNHTYSKPGNYTIRLIVNDNDNLTSAFFTTITIYDEPVEELEDEEIEEGIGLLLILLFTLFVIFLFVAALVIKGKTLKYLSKKPKKARKLSEKFAKTKEIKKTGILSKRLEKITKEKKAGNLPKKLGKIREIKKAANLSKKLGKIGETKIAILMLTKKIKTKIKTQKPKITEPQLPTKEAEIIQSKKGPIEKGTPVLLQETGEIIGNIDDVIYNDDKDVTGVKLKYISTKEVVDFPIDLFDNKEIKLVFKPNSFDKDIDTLKKLETKGQKFQGLSKQLADNIVSNDEIYKIFVKHDAEMAGLLKDAVELKEEAALLKESLNNRLLMLKKQYILLNDKLEGVEYKPLAKRSKLDDNIIKDLKTKMKRIDFDIRKCEDLLKRFEEISFGDFSQTDVNKS